MRAIATPLITARRPSTSAACSPELAESALQHMKGCPASVEGIDDCAVAYLMGLSAAAVERLARAWDAGWGFPTASRLAALQNHTDGTPLLPATRKAGDSA